MKTQNNILRITAAALATAALLSGCVKEAAEQDAAKAAQAAEGEYELVVEVGETPATKTTITQDGTVLPVVWKTGDKLYVAGATDGYVGCLELEETQSTGEGVGYHKAKFSGKMSGWTSTQVMHFYYLGSSEPTLTGNKFTFDISSQEGTLEWIEGAGHISHAATETALAPGTHTLSLTMKNMNAVVLYDLSAWTSGVEISGTYNKATLDLKEGKFAEDGYTTGSIALAADKCTASTYVTFVPDNKALTFKKGAVAKTSTLANNVEAGRFYSDEGNAIKIPKMVLGQWVDLGLSVLWASTNLGADSEGEIGDYYAWGETTTKETYKWNNYKHGTGSQALTKYCTNSNYGNVDNLNTLLPEDDAATVVIGGDAYTPTTSDWAELYDGNNCSFDYLTSGTTSTVLPSFTAPSDGLLIVSKVLGYEGNHIFLPVTAMRADNGGDDPTSVAQLWSLKSGVYQTSTLCSVSPNQPNNARFANFKINGTTKSSSAYLGGFRYRGFTVRAVKPKPAETVEFIDLDLTSGTLWANKNVGASLIRSNGDYFAYGELNPYYTSINQKDPSTAVFEGDSKCYNVKTYCNGSATWVEWTPTPYDSETKVLKSGYDVCTQKFDASSHVPTIEQWQELMDECTWLTYLNCYRVSSKTNPSKFILLPMAGTFNGMTYSQTGSDGYVEGRYWSSKHNNERYSKAIHFNRNGTVQIAINSARALGFSVRAVKDAPLPHYIDDNGDHGEGIQIGSVIWAPVNCEYDPTNFPYGKLYQWGRKTGEGYASPEALCTVEEGPVSATAEDATKHYTHNSDWLSPQNNARWNSAASPNDASQTGIITPTKTTYDPCPINWRIPTYHELDALRMNKSSWTTKDGQKGFYFTGGMTYSENVPRVFLPAAGYRGYNTGNTNSSRTSVGSYWSSTVSSTTDGYAYYLFTNSSTASMVKHSRAYALPIRCVYCGE